MAATPRSLAAHYPKQWDVWVLLIGSAVTLIVGYTLPLMAIEKLVFWEDGYTLITSVTGLWSSGNYVLAAIIFLFSIVFPCVKLAALAVAWWKPFEQEARDRLVRAVGLLGKWSMLDVFVCALLIVLTQSRSFVDAAPRAGLFVFTAAILGSIIVSMRVESLARRAGNDAGSGDQGSGTGDRGARSHARRAGND